LTPASSDVGADLRSGVLVVDGEGHQQPDAAAGAADNRESHALDNELEDLGNIKLG